MQLKYWFSNDFPPVRQSRDVRRQIRRRIPASGTGPWVSGTGGRRLSRAPREGACRCPLGLGRRSPSVQWSAGGSGLDRPFREAVAFHRHGDCPVQPNALAAVPVEFCRTPRAGTGAAGGDRPFAGDVSSAPELLRARVARQDCRGQGCRQRLARYESLTRGPRTSPREARRIAALCRESRPRRRRGPGR